MTDQQGGAPVHLEWPGEEFWPQGGYANMFLVNHTPWDFTLRFGFAAVPPVAPGFQPPAEGITAQVSPVAQVTLSPRAMQQLVLILQRQIAGYTQSFGDIGGNPEEGIS